MSALVSVRKLIKGPTSYVEVVDYRTGIFDQKLVEVLETPKVDIDKSVEFHIEDIAEAIKELAKQGKTTVLRRSYVEGLRKRGHEFDSAALLIAEEIKEKPYYHSYSIVEREKAPAAVKPKVVTEDDGKVVLEKKAPAAAKGMSKAAMARAIIAEMKGKPEAEVIAAIKTRVGLTDQLARVYFKNNTKEGKREKALRKVKKRIKKETK